MAYYVFSVNGRKRLALPAGPKVVRLAALSRLQITTFKRLLYFRIVRWAIILGCERWLSGRVSDPIDPGREFSLHAWMQERRDEMHMPELLAAVFWPPQPGRGRVHVHLLDRNAALRGFAKIAFDDEDKEGLRTEQAALREMAHEANCLSRTPRVLGAGTFGACEYLVTEPIPGHMVPFAPRVSAFPLGVVRELAGPLRTVTPRDFAALSWWAEFEAYFDARAPFFFALLKQRMSKGITVCRTHGDLCAENLGVCGDELWVYDWERNRPDGPWMYDEITFYLGCVRGRIFTHGDTVFRALTRHFLEGRLPEDCLAVMLSLGVMASECDADAREVVRLWDERRYTF